MSGQVIAQQRPQPLQVHPVAHSVLQRCSNGVECAECKAKREQRERGGNLQRAAVNTAPAPAHGVPPIVHTVLNSPGQALGSGTRSFMESRFGHDFSNVRVHTNAQAVEAARSVNALAYTVGRDIVFGTGQYQPETMAGKRLLAHELTHVVQQRGQISAKSSLAISPPATPAEQEAEAVSERILQGQVLSPYMGLYPPMLHRKVTVDDAKVLIPNPTGTGLVKTNAETIEGYLTTVCSGGNVIVNKGSGIVTMNTSYCTSPTPPGIVGPPQASPAEASKEPTGCGCLCDMVSSTNEWHIVVDDASWPHTDFTDPDAANCKKPGGSGGIVTAPSPNSPKLWGAGTASGKTLDIDPWLVLGHELCGHGWLGNAGKHCSDETAPRGEGGHQETVKRENELRAEHGIEARGSFKDPNCGESYSRDKAAPGTVNWSSFRTKCQAWRDAYNKAHGTKYKITDKIP
ncbi:MAG TPA: DUF4157 domain-containing protein [Ktedonobacteraceae bacterium]|nr:DUF4157 domain-containing protein [Ktedonobacteraceae bacterium]